MLPEVLKYLFDIRQACELLNQFINGKSWDDYLNDVLLQSAVERQFMIIGEALFQAIKIDPSLSVAISGSRRIINFRHVMVHGYATIEPSTVWGVVESDLPVLESEIDTLVKDSIP